MASRVVAGAARTAICFQSAPRASYGDQARKLSVLVRQSARTGQRIRLLEEVGGLHGRGQLQVRRAKTQSMDLELGTPAPDFKLVEPLTGKVWTLDDVAHPGATALLVMIICNHCPFVKLLKESYTALAKEYMTKGVAVVAISPNSVQTHPQDGPEEMAKDAHEFGYPFPYLYDENQEAAKAYRAAATPEFYVFDSARTLVYHGQYDDARPNGDVQPTGRDVAAALDAVLEGRAVPTSRPSIGCNIKWTPGNEPTYFGATAV